MFTPDKLYEYINELGIEYKELSKSYVYTCPRCNKKDIVYQFKSSGYFTCMKEGWCGPAQYLIAELANIPIEQVNERLYGAKWVNTSNLLNFKLVDFIIEDDPIDFEIISEVKWPFDSFPIEHKFSVKGLEYLQSRGIPLNIASKYGIRYWPSTQRVLFPVYYDNRLLGYQARLRVPERVWNNDLEVFREAPKIVSSENLPTSRMVMFADNLNNSEFVIIAEGPFDGIKFDQIGSNIATMGKTVTRGQINFIRSKGIKKIYTALDRDASRATERLVREFNDLEVFNINPLPGKDFGAMSFEECNSAFNSAQQAFTGKLYFYLRT